MSKYKIATIIALFLTVIFLCLLFGFDESSFISFVAAVISLLLFFSFLAISIGEKRCRNFSPYRIFAIVNCVIGVCMTVYAIYDIKTKTDKDSIGELLLMTVIPFVMILLLADLIVWYMNRRKEKKNRDSGG